MSVTLLGLSLAAIVLPYLTLRRWLCGGNKDTDGSRTQ